MGCIQQRKTKLERPTELQQYRLYSNVLGERDVYYQLYETSESVKSAQGFMGRLSDLVVDV